MSDQLDQDDDIEAMAARKGLIADPERVAALTSKLANTVAEHFWQPLSLQDKAEILCAFAACVTRALVEHDDPRIAHLFFYHSLSAGLERAAAVERQGLLEDRQALLVMISQQMTRQ